MAFKYEKGQSVKVINPKDRHGYPKYSTNPDIKNHVGGIVTIVNLKPSLVRTLGDDALSQPLYDVCLDEIKETIIDIPEDALEPY